MGDSKCSLESDELFEFYEKHYFHEVEMREKHLARVQFSLAMFVAVCSLLSYMFSNIKTFHWDDWKCVAFVVSMTLCAVFLAIAFYFFLKSFFNYTYQFLPTAKVTEDYRQTLITTYAPYPDQDELVGKYFKEYLFNLYVQCATLNAENNELRSAHFHNTTKLLIPAFVFAIFALIFFFFGQINKDEQKELKVKVTNPIEFKGGNPDGREQSSRQFSNKRNSATTATTATSKRVEGRRRNNSAWICREQEVMTDKDKQQEKPVPPPPPPPPAARKLKDHVEEEK